MRSDPASSNVFRPRMPRQHAQLILAAGSDAARAVLWAKVPTAWRSLVQAHMDQTDAHAQQKVCHREKLRPPVSTSFTPVLADYKQPVCIPGNPLVAAQHLAALRASIHSTRASQ